MADTSTPALQKVPNFRDVGLSINNYSSHASDAVKENSRTRSAELKTGLLYRSAKPDDATPLDRMHLADAYQIKTIIDLRTASEHAEQAQRNALKTKTGEVDEEVLHIPNVEYININFNGRAYSNAILWQLGYYDLARFLGLYAMGWRRDAIAVIGKEVMAKRGLVGLAEDSLRYCTAEIKAVFEVLGDRERYPVLVHCTQGKDRTGLTVLLVLMLLGVEEERIERDYRVSEEMLEGDREKRLREIRSIGLSDEFAGCPEDWTRRVVKCVEEEFGGVERYLEERCGVRREQMERVRRILLVDEWQAVVMGGCRLWGMEVDQEAFEKEERLLRCLVDVRYYCHLDRLSSAMSSMQNIDCLTCLCSSRGVIDLAGCKNGM